MCNPVKDDCSKGMGVKKKVSRVCYKCVPNVITKYDIVLEMVNQRLSRAELV